jgi:hypothetical protein
MSMTKVTSGIIDTLDASKITGTMPAIDGSALTGIGGGGKVLQVVSNHKSNQVGSSVIDTWLATGLEANITLSSATSKVFIMYTMPMHHSQPAKRTVTTVFRGAAGTTNLSPNANMGLAMSQNDDSGYGFTSVETGCVVDSNPNSTSQLLYTVGWKILNSGLTAYPMINNSNSSIILMEIAE